MFKGTGFRRGRFSIQILEGRWTHNSGVNDHRTAQTAMALIKPASNQTISHAVAISIKIKADSKFAKLISSFLPPWPEIWILIAAENVAIRCKILSFTNLVCWLLLLCVSVGSNILFTSRPIGSYLFCKAFLLNEQNAVTAVSRNRRCVKELIPQATRKQISLNTILYFAQNFASHDG